MKQRTTDPRIPPASTEHTGISTLVEEHIMEASRREFIKASAVAGVAGVAGAACAKPAPATSQGEQVKWS
ncbi:MAG: twin-arginine translocation signal domain-containing protein, partial [Phycisphaerales bacterium]|nr:twin-arginine translocation signal domain-containing protein [Phycisphaerales bacterium]